MRAEEFSEAFEEAIFAAHAADRLDWIADHPRGKENPSVSDAGKCPRQVAYTLRNVEPSDPPDSASLLNFMVGHAVEEALARAFAARPGAKVEREKRVEIPCGYAPNETKVTGRIDFIISDPAMDCLIEVKSTSSKALDFMLKKEPGGREEHRRQLNLYLHHEKRSLGILVYVAKDAAKSKRNLVAIPMPYDKARAFADLEHLASLHTRVKAGEEIYRPAGYTPSKFPCSYCDFRSKCWQG